jgi:DNA repair protein RecO (recombination protein O)
VDEFVTVTGMVLSSSPMGEYDRRLCLLTLERGKISAFARGARRPKSALMAGCRQFTFGKFALYEGKNAYTVRSIEVKSYFSELAADPERACYGFYFLELTEYYTRENADEAVVMKLLYQALRALSNEHLPNPLVRAVFELKIMMLNGDYLRGEQDRLSEGVQYALEYILVSPPERVFTFTLTDDRLKELTRFAQKNCHTFLDREFKTLTVLEEVVRGGA